MNTRYEVPIISKSAVAHGITEITLDISKTNFHFQAGQYATLTLPDAITQPTTSQFHDFSIVSSPNDHEKLKIAFRNSDSFFKKAILSLPLGAPIILEGPSGNFILPKAPTQPIVFIAGGIGITPFMSMLSAINEQNLPFQITLFYSNKDSSSITYGTELQAMAKLNPSLKLVFTVTNDTLWQGETKPINSDLIASYTGDLEQSLYYIAGPPSMVFSLRDDLREAGAPEANILTEGFTGLEIEQILTGSDYNALISSLDKTALVSMTDAKGHIIYANNKFIEISKYSLQELLGQNHRILKSGHQPDELFDQLWDTISAGKVWRGEIKNKAKDGSYYWVDTSIAPILGPDGLPERYISVRFLITERKEKEETLSGLLSALDQTALVSMTDAKGNITYANQKFVEVSKYALYELMGQNHRILKSGTQPQSLFIKLWDDISHGRVWRGEIKNKAKDGSFYWVDTSIAPIMGSGGHPERFISVRFLVTDKKEREQALQKTMVTDNAILASISDGLVATDHAGRIILVNPAAERMLGWQRGEMLDKPIEDVLSIRSKDSMDVPLQNRPLHQALSTKQPVPVSTDYFFVRKDGQKFPVAVSADPITLDGTTIGVIEVFHELPTP